MEGGEANKSVGGSMAGWQWQGVVIGGGAVA